MQNRIASAFIGLSGRVASAAGPSRMRAVARFNRRVTNPVLRLFASRLPAFAVIEHTGRRSGTAYRTPVLAFIEKGAFIAPLNYGAGSDWVRNIQAAGSAGITHRGRRYRLTEPRVVPAGSPDLPTAVREGTTAESLLRATLVRSGGR